MGCEKLLEDRHQVWVLDDLSNGRLENIEELKNDPGFIEFINGDIKDAKTLEDLS